MHKLLLEILFQFMKYQIRALLIILLVVAQSKLDIKDDQNLKIQVSLPIQQTQINHKGQSLGKEVLNILPVQQVKAKTIAPLIRQDSFTVQKPTTSQENAKISTEKLMKALPPSAIIEEIGKKSQTIIIDGIQNEKISIQQQNKPFQKIVQNPKFIAKIAKKKLIQNVAQPNQKNKAIFEHSIQKKYSQTKDLDLIQQIQSNKQILKVDPVQNIKQAGFQQKLVQITKPEEKISINTPDTVVQGKQSLDVQKGIDNKFQQFQIEKPIVLSKKVQVAPINQVVNKNSELPLITPKIEENQQLSNKIQKPHVIITDYREYFPTIKAKPDINLGVKQQVTLLNSKLPIQQLKTGQKPIKTQIHQEVLPSRTQKLVQTQLKPQVNNIQPKINPFFIPSTTTINLDKLSQINNKNVQDRKQLKQYLPISKNKQDNSPLIIQQPQKQILTKEKLPVDPQITPNKLDQAKKLVINQGNDNQVDKTILQSNNQENLLSKISIVSKAISKTDPVVSAQQSKQNKIQLQQEIIKQTTVNKQQVIENLDIKGKVVTPIQQKFPKIVENKQILSISKQIQSQISTVQKPKISQVEQNQQYLNKIQSSNTVVPDFREYFPMNKARVDINELKTSTVSEKQIKLADRQQTTIVDKMQEAKETNREIKSIPENLQKYIKPINDQRQQDKITGIKQKQVQILPQQIDNKVKDIINSPQQNIIDSQKYKQQIKVVQTTFNNPIIQKQQLQNSEKEVKQLVKQKQNQQFKKINEINKETKDTTQSLQISNQVKQIGINQDNSNKQIDANKIIIKAQQESHKTEQRINMLENTLKQLMDMLEKQKQKTKKLEQKQKTVQKQQKIQTINPILQTQATKSVSQKLKDEQTKNVQTFNSQNIVPQIKMIDDIEPPGQNLKAEQNNVPIKTDLSQITPSVRDNKVSQSELIKDIPSKEIDVTNANSTAMTQNIPTQNVISKETHDEIVKIYQNEKSSQTLKDHKREKPIQTQNINQKKLKSEETTIAVPSVKVDQIKPIDKKEVKSDIPLQESIKAKVSTGKVTPIQQNVVDKSKETLTSIQTNPIAQILIQENVKKIEQNKIQIIEQKQPIIVTTEKKEQIMVKAQNEVNQKLKKLEQQNNHKNQVQQRPYNAFQAQVNKKETIVSDNFKQQAQDIHFKQNSGSLQYSIDDQNVLKKSNQKLKSKQKSKPKKYRKSLSSVQQQNDSYDVLQQYRKLQQHKKQSLKSPVNKQKITKQPEIQKSIVQPHVIVVKPMTTLTKAIISVFTLLILVIIGKEIYHRKIADSTQQVKQEQDFTIIPQTGIEVAEGLDEEE